MSVRESQSLTEQLSSGEAGFSTGDKLYSTSNKALSSELKNSSHTNSQLDAAEEGSKESYHTEELHATQVLHNELLTDVGDSIQRRSSQNQKIPEQLLFS